MRLAHHTIAVALLGVTPLLVAAPVPKETAAERLVRLYGTPADPARDCRFALDESDVLSVRVPGSPHRLVPNDVRSTAPRALRAVTGDFVATVAVRPVRVGDGDPAGVTFNAGLCVIGDGGEYLYHARRTAVVGDQRLATGAYGARTPAAQLALDSSADEAYRADTVALRVVRTGGQFRLAVSAGGDRWADVGAVRTDFPARLSVGVFAAQDGPVPFAAAFEAFTLTTGK